MSEMLLHAWKWEKIAIDPYNCCVHLYWPGQRKINGSLNKILVHVGLGGDRGWWRTIHHLSLALLPITGSHPMDPIPAAWTWLGWGSWTPGGHWCEENFPFLCSQGDDDLWGDKWASVSCVESRGLEQMSDEVWGWQWGEQLSPLLLLIPAWPLPAVPLGQFVIIWEKILAL